MTEKHIPTELMNEINDFNLKTNENKFDKTENDIIDEAVENATSEEVVQMKAWKSEIPQTTIQDLPGEVKLANQNESSNPLSSLRKKAGKWGRGVLAAAALSVGTEAVADERVNINRPEIQTTHKLTETKTHEGKIQISATESKMIGVTYQDLANELLTTDKINFKGSTIKSESMFRSTWGTSLRDVYSQYQLYKKSPTPGLKEVITNNLKRLEKMVAGGNAPIKPEILQEFGLK
ncbi:MAG: hypothetical protein WC725_01710 [Patescibacteria group bacterium]|jgi:hypothetical protein